MHYAVRSAEKYGTSRIVRALLLKGARTDLRDNNGMLAFDYLQEYETHLPEMDQFKRELESLINDESSSKCISKFNIFNPVTKIKKIRKSKKTIITYCILMIIVECFITYVVNRFIKPSWYN